jgi:hypothetical protein
MHLRITKEPSWGGKDGNDSIYYLREVPHDPGRTIQATSLTLEGARWMAGRITGVTRLEIPRDES